MSEAENLEAVGPEPQVSPAVLFEGITAAVESVAVRFDDERVLLPKEIDGEWPDRRVYVRYREALAPTKVEEAVLQLATAAIQVALVREAVAQKGRLTACPAELGPGKPPSAWLPFEIEDGPARSCHRNAEAAGSVIVGQDLGSVQPDSIPVCPAPVPTYDDLDHASVIRQ